MAVILGLLFLVFVTSCGVGSPREAERRATLNAFPRTASTMLSQEVWPSTEGNEVEIVYRDSVTADIRVVLYGESGRTEYAFTTLREQMTRGAVYMITYNHGPIHDAPSSTIDEDTCTYAITRGVNGSIACTLQGANRTDGRDECDPCADVTRDLTKLIREVEHLVVANR
jgi:hypothetical protein